MAVTLNGLNSTDPSAINGSAGEASQVSQATVSGAAAAGTAKGAGATQSDVSFSSLSTSMADLERSLTSSDPVSQGRVQAVSAALDAGTYSINADKVAAGFMQSQQLLGQLKGGN